MKKIWLCLPLFFYGLQIARGQDFYDINTVQEIRIQFLQPNWDHLLDSLKDANDQVFLAAATVEINGQVFNSVGVKYKGNNSYDPDYAKNPFHLELDYLINDQNYLGIKDIKLGNAYSDPSFLREVLAFEMIDRYADAPRANYARVWINGAYWGVFVNIESINKPFARSRFFTDGENPFFKCNPDDYDGPGTGGNFSDLVYEGPDSNSYDQQYKLESDYGWFELISLMDSLANHPAGIASQLDVDRVLWMLAFNNATVNLDSYTGAYAQNYYLYYDENGRWIPIVWDLNLGFGAFPLLVPPGGITGLPLSLSQMQQLSPLAQADNTGRPLIRQLLAQPTWQRMYLAHLRTLLEENFAAGQYLDRAEEIQALIGADVQSDPKKFFTYAEFQSNLTESVDGGFAGNIPGLSELMDARYAYLAAHPLLAATPPSISGVGTESTGGNTVWVTAQIGNAVTAWAGWRYDSAAVFQTALFYDDGQHHDGAAADGVFGAAIPLLSPQIQYFIYAENNNAGRFLPARAEHEFFIYNATLATAAAGQVVLNELLADNETGSTDEAGEREDWLELFNTTNQTLSLAGLHLSDKPSAPDKWTFPAGAFIPAGGYLIVWLDEDLSQGPYHANFKLSATGETILLSGDNLTIFDQVVVGGQQPDISYGRYPNGTGPFVFMPTTFNGPNSLTSGSEVKAQETFRLFPNPVNHTLHVESNQALGPVRVMDALGRTHIYKDIKNSTVVELDFGHLPAGLYCLIAGSGLTTPVLVQH